MIMSIVGGEAPELDVVEWFNTESPLTLADLRGRVVMLHAFQMLCPGCVLSGTPLAQRIHERHVGPDLAVIGLHTVFEHHDAMTPVSLAAYLHEFHITMPVAVDRNTTPRGMPATMQAYRMQGTPTHVLIDVPVGSSAKVRSVEAAAHLGRLLVEVGAAVGLKVQV
ncbi:MAG: hypothetical protein DYH08_08755, partial [Actinobacteria bacterium ATB1]|nr:hypothetical protein [Actinobacteria bacterium ATB1]